MGLYQDYINSLNPDHYWPLETDEANVGSISLSIPNPAGYIQGPAITAGSLGSAQFTGGNALDYGDSTINVGGPWFTRSYSLWGSFDDPNRDSLLYNEGAGVRNFSLYFGIGGTPAYIVDNDADNNPGCPWSEAIYGPALVPGRPYHMGMVWQTLGAGTVGGGSYVTAYLNGQLLQTKLVFQTGTNLAGGQFNSHSGNIELGLGQQIIVSQQTFNVSDHVGLLADCAVWDNIVISPTQMQQLYELGAVSTSVDATFTNVPSGLEIRLFELDALGGNVLSEFGGVESAATATVEIPYNVAVSVPARIALVSTQNRIVYRDVTLTRAGATFPVDLLVQFDRNFSNP